MMRVVLAAALLLAWVLAPLAAADAPQDETYWRKRAEMLHKQAADAQARYDAVVAEWTRLKTKNRDRGDRRVQMRRRRQEAEEELRIAKERLEALPEEARRAGVPPGWVRVFLDEEGQPEG